MNYQIDYTHTDPALPYTGFALYQPFSGVKGRKMPIPVGAMWIIIAAFAVLAFIAGVSLCQ